VAGSSRSGTTWLVDVLNYRNDFRYVHEPLGPGQLASMGHYRSGQYLRPDNNTPTYLEPMRAVLGGHVRGRALDRYNRKLVATKRLVKDVDANLLLKWLHLSFPGMPIVMALRHPCGVMTSRLANFVSADAGFAPRLDRFLAQEELVADWLEPFADTITGAHSALDQQILWWCIENYVPLSQFAAGEIHIVWYERLVAEPYDELGRLSEFLSMPFKPDVHAKMRRYSLTTGPFSPLHAGRSPMNSWTRNWSHDEVRRVMQILSRFGLDEIYTDNPMPRVEGIAALFGRGEPAVGLQSDRAVRIGAQAEG
jgi:hypothetical protein